MGQKISKIKWDWLQIQNFRLLFWCYLTIQQAVVEVVGVHFGNKVGWLIPFVRRRIPTDSQVQKDCLIQWWGPDWARRLYWLYRLCWFQFLLTLVWVGAHQILHILLLLISFLRRNIYNHQRLLFLYILLQSNRLLSNCKHTWLLKMVVLVKTVIRLLLFSIWLLGGAPLFNSFHIF